MKSRNFSEKPNNDGEVFVEHSYAQLFIRFLRYGFLAWGGPIAQLALIQREMVYQEKAISIGYFNRLVALYQAFPGPETHEICVHLGTQAKGPLGGLLAGLGFMMPGFILMMFFSYIYILYGITALATSILLGIKPAVIAWIIKGGILLARGILLNKILWVIAVVAFFAELYTINFVITFLLAGLLYSVIVRHKNKSVRKADIPGTVRINKYPLIMLIIVGICLFIFAYVLSMLTNSNFSYRTEGWLPLSTFLFGLKCGSLSFGSVYTVLSIIKADAIAKSHWLTQTQFIDGLALAGSLPAPFIIVTTFVGYMAYGFWGGVLATIGTFFIPFLIPMLGQKYLNYIATNKIIRTFLDGVTAAVAGLIAADVLDILRQVLISPLTISVFIGSLLFLYFYRSPYGIICIVFVGGLLGMLFHLLS